MNKLEFKISGKIEAADPEKASKVLDQIFKNNSNEIELDFIEIGAWRFTYLAKVIP